MLTIGTVMSEGAVAVNEHCGVSEIVATVERCRARTVAVVDAFGRLLGAIERDNYPELFAHWAPRAPRAAGTRRQRDRRARIGHCTAQDLMTPFPVVTDTSTVAAALESLDRDDADLAFVVDGLGCVVGTVTTLACRAILRTATDRLERPLYAQGRA